MEGDCNQTWRIDIHRERRRHAAGSLTPSLPPAATCGMETLPDALILSIFECLDAATLLNRVVIVSKRFCSIVETSQSLWLSRLPMLAASMRADSGGIPPLRLPKLYCELYNTNLLLNPWLSLEEQLAARRSDGGDVPGRGKVPWLALGGGHHWAWGEPAAEGLTTVPCADPPMPPPPHPPLPQQVGCLALLQAVLPLVN